MRSIFKYFSFLILYFSVLNAQSPLDSLFINEVMSANSNIIADEDGDYPDWIELYNSGNSSFDITGFGLTDDSDYYKWILPDLSLHPREHLLIFASDKDRRSSAKHWETIINWGDIWKYKTGTSEPPADWKDIAFDDSSWSSGPSGFGYGDGDDSTVVSQIISVYIRKKFTISDINDILLVQMHVDYDDAFVAYLNGIEIARENIGQVGVPPVYNEWATSSSEAQIYQGGLPKVYSEDNIRALLNNGENVLAIQVHNYGPTSSDMTLIPFFTLGLNSIPSNPSGMPQLIQFSIPNLHTNFKISSTGETLTLTSTSGQTVDQLATGSIPPNISYGRQPDGSSNWYYFDQATPGDSNITQGFISIATEPAFSIPGGFYSDSVIVELSTGAPNDTIKYTLDGSEPDETSLTYSSPISITHTTVLRARNFSYGNLPGKIITNSYFVNEYTTLPVVSLATNPANFWDDQIGIYVEGTNGITGYCSSTPKNWNQDWERPVSLEFFEPLGVPGFKINSGVKIGGGCTRLYAEKSLAIYTRSGYGDSEINYKIFTDKPLEQFNNIMLRNGGQDWYRAIIRDGMMQNLVKNRMDIDWQCFRPAILFINGEYWGIHNIREKHNEHYIAANHGIDPDAIDILSGNASVKQGSPTLYLNLLNYIDTHDLSVQANYEYIATQMEIDEYINYQIAEIYFANIDWPGGNIKYWRPKTPDGKWRWILFDLDLGFGAHPYGQYSSNTLANATATSQTYYANPTWSTYLFRKLLENDSFKIEFIQRYCAHISTTFEKDRVINIIDSLQTIIAPEVSRHLIKWPASLTLSNNWQQHIEIMREFARSRPGYARYHIKNNFGLGGYAKLTFLNNSINGGKIKVNEVEIIHSSTTIKFFRDIPVRIEAIPNPGYQFAGWQGLLTSSEDSIAITLIEDDSITANFIPQTAQSSPIVINEINYNSASNFDPEDWIEFYNNTDSTIDLSGWKFKDEDDSHVFVFPQNTILLSDSFLVLCRDSIQFHSLFTQISNCVGSFDFGFSGSGELLRIFNANDDIIDFVEYDDETPWPTEPDGNGPTLGLKNPDSDNNLPESWSATSGHGTPGRINDVYTGQDRITDLLLPNKLQLYQNYPNPFNPTTTIEFSIPKTEFVTLKIYNLLGQEMATLVSEELTPKNYKYFWNASGFSNGVYFYKFEAGKFLEIKKMILMK
jgi:hypothetical protein